MLKQANSIAQRASGAIDALTDRFSPYRLMLYFLLALLGWNILGSFDHQVPYSWQAIVLSAGWLVLICWAVSKLFGWALKLPSNKESGLISGLILALILSPASSANDYLVLAAAALLAMASKYLLVYKRTHIFNPAAVGAFIAGVVFHHYAAWWVGTSFSAPLLILGGLLILHKIKRFSLFLVFGIIYILFLIWTLPAGSSADAIHHLVWLGIIGTPLLFFSIVMLGEPLTSPAGWDATLVYAVVVGVFYSYNRLHTSPEEALLIGNLLAFIIAPNRRYKLSFIRRVKNAEGIYSYVFSAPKNFHFRAGQYMQWTLSAPRSDSRGNRRYLTISSSPTEPELAFSVKLPPKPSTFKQHLESLKPGDNIFASYLAGSFILPDDPSKKLALVAGGVGITPFRSMIKSLVDSREQRDIAVLYSANKPEELAFQDLLAQAKAVGLKNLSAAGLIDKATILKCLPDYKERTFYVSGPYLFVQSIKKTLNELGVAPAQVKTDYFPGYGA